VRNESKMLGLMSFLVSQVYILAGRSVVDAVYEDRARASALIRKLTGAC
jgi:hypothetical protein